MFYEKRVTKEVIREYKDGKLVRERTIINDGGTSKEEAESRLNKAEKDLDKQSERMKKAFGSNGIFAKMDELFKDLF